GERHRTEAIRTPRSGIRQLLFPHSVAVVGASPRFAETISALVAGDVPAWGVHPRHTDVLGLQCVPRMADLDELPEVALLLVGHERVEDAFEEAAAAGVRAFVLPGLGAEAGRAGAPIIARIAARAQELDAAILGPNCMGVARPGGGSLWIGTVPETFVNGHVTVVAQSGSVAEALVTAGPRIGFRAVISCGGEMARDAADFVSFLADDPGTRAIGLFLETVRRPAAFAAALEACAVTGKPVVCLKVGSSAAGARAALAHTGALVGSDRALGAVLRRFGVIPVEDVHDLIETLELLGARRPRPVGRRIGAISESGGECALLADRGEAAGLPFAPLTDELASRLSDAFPNYLAPANPLDAWAIDEAERVYPASLELLAASGEFDLLLAQVDLSQYRGDSEGEWCEMIVRSLAAAVEGRSIFPAVTSVGSSDPPAQIAAAARRLDVPLLRGAGHAMRALAAVAGWAPPEPRQPAAGHAVTLEAVIGARTDGALPEYESAQILEAYGVPVAPRHRAADPNAAVTAARELGLPVVVKVDGPAHKSATGGVVLGLDSLEAVRRAAIRLGGHVLVARQIEPGVELLCGLLRDRDHGPVLAVGRGGGAVEETRPVLCLAPVDRGTALALVREAGLPSGAESLADVLVALGRLALEQPRIVAVDINPLILGPAGAIAVDALVEIGAANE
ncbi:MAG TPA: acetate--CoA ligase family protein, partial [Solirubrobacteraceae bacterium]|nr:acetate--CoA ligase family protein [Solirubrobacteraceae bacterium]